jgi:predicted dehydrogenase
MDMTRVLSVVVEGGGAEARRHQAGYACLPGVEVEALDADAGDLSGAAGTADLVDLCLSPTRLFAASQQVIPAGTAVLLPLPMASRTREARMMQSLARRYKARLFCLHPLRFHPALARLKEMVDSGVLGRMARMQIVAGGGRDLAMAVDVCNWLAGTPRKIEVAGTQICLVYEQGVTVSIEGRGAGVARGMLGVSLEGELGHALWRYDDTREEEKIEISLARGQRRLYAPRVDPLLLQLASIANELRTGQGGGLVAVKEAYSTLEILNKVQWILREEGLAETWAAGADSCCQDEAPCAT